MSTPNTIQTRSKKYSDKEENTNMADNKVQSTATAAITNEHVKTTTKKKGEKECAPQSQLKQSLNANKKVKGKDDKDAISEEDIPTETPEALNSPKGMVAERIDQINSNPSSPVKMPKMVKPKVSTKPKLPNRVLIAKNGQLGLQSPVTQYKACADDKTRHKTLASEEQEEGECDLQTILKQLNTTVTRLDKRLGQMDQERRMVEQRVNLVEICCQQDEGQITQLREKVEEQNEKIQALIGTVVRQDQQIQTLTHQVNSAYANNTQKNIIINGLSETQGENCMHEVAHMFKHILKIDKPISIKSARRIGKGQSKPMLVKLAKIQDKATIFQKLGNIKHANQGRQRPIFITDQLPEAWAERKRFIHHVKQQNKKLPKDQQHKIQVQANQLLINDVVYEPPVKAPTVSEFLNLPPERKQIIKNLQVIKGQQDLQQQSLFIGYAAAISSTEELDNLYYHVRLLNPEATHVMCAFKLPGTNFVDTQAIIDDGEYGGGRVIMNLLNKTEASNRAVFVV